jgi:hypothetical protein
MASQATLMRAELPGPTALRLDMEDQSRQAIDRRLAPQWRRLLLAPDRHLDAVSISDPAGFAPGILHHDLRDLVRHAKDRARSSSASRFRPGNGCDRSPGTSDRVDALAVLGERARSSRATIQGEPAFPSRLAKNALS